MKFRISLQPFTARALEPPSGRKKGLERGEGREEEICSGRISVWRMRLYSSRETKNNFIPQEEANFKSSLEFSLSSSPRMIPIVCISFSFPAAAVAITWFE